MRILISTLCFVMLSLSLVYGQEVVYEGELSDRDGGDNLSGVQVKAFANGSETYSTTTGRRGEYVVKLPVGKVYTIKYMKNGYVTKTMRVDVTGVNEEDLPIGGNIMPPVDIDLFTTKESVDFSFLEEEPVVTWEYDNRNLIMDWDRKVYNNMKKRIDDLLAEAENKEKEEKENDAKYNSLIKEADSFYNDEEYEQALAKYEAALQVPGKQTEEHPNNRLIEIENLLQEIAEKELEEKQSDQAYQNLISAADNLAINKEYDKAISKYEEALKLKPGEQYPLDKINEVSAAKKAAQEQKEYDQLIKQGDELFGQNNLESARDKYTNAAKLFQDESYPKEQLQKIQDKLDTEKAIKENKQKYDDAIAEADRLFEEEKYEQSIVKYKKAVEYDDTVDYPKDRIKLSEQKLAEQQEKERNKEKVDALVKEADILANSKQYEKAITKYDEALALTSTPEIEQKKQNTVQKLEALKNEKEKTEKIEKLLISAKESFEAGSYKNALDVYNEVLSMDQANTKAIEGAEKSKLALKKKEEEESLNEEFDQLVSNADQLYTNKKWIEAEKMYVAAKDLIDDDSHVNERLVSVRKTISENEALAEQEEEIRNLLDQAARQKSDEKWDEAIASYEEVLAIKADHSEAKTLLNETKNLKEEWIANKENQEKFDKLKTEGDQLFAQQKWEQAKGKYQAAKDVKASSEVDGQLKIIEQELSKLSSAKEKDEKYNEAMAAASSFEKDEEYKKAIDKYKDALAYKEGDAEATNKIKELQQKIKSLENEAEKEEKYLAAIEKGKAAFDDEDYSAAIKFYDDALELKPMDPEALRLKRVSKTELDQLSSQEEQFQKLLSEAKEEKDNEQLEVAKDLYVQARQMKPKDPIPQTAIVEIDELLRQREEALAEQSEQEKIDQDYQNKLDLAEVAAQNFKYEKAIDHLKEASRIKPEEDYPRKKINEYQALIDQIEAQNDIEKRFDDAIRKADKAFMNKKYNESIDLYAQALKIKKNDDYAKSQIQKAEDALNILENNSLDAEFNAIVAKANEAFDNEEYEKALTRYEEALMIKSDDTFAKDRRDETKQIIEDLANEEVLNSEKDKEFQKLIIEADDLFDNKQYIDAKDKYEAALEIKQNNAHAIRREQESIEKAKEKVNTGDEERYQKIVSKADEYFDEENYDKATSLYERALSLRSYDKYPKAKIAEIKAILSKPEKPEVNLEYLGEEEDISILEGQALLEEAKRKRQSMKQESVQGIIRKNEENFEAKTLDDYNERLDYQNEIVRISDKRATGHSDEVKQRLDIASQIDDDMFSISKQRMQENKFERGSILRQNERITYISDDYSATHKEKATAHLINADKIDEIAIQRDAQSLAESTNDRIDIQNTHEELEEIVDNKRDDYQRAIVMRKENEQKVDEIQKGKEIRTFEEINDNYAKLQRIEDQATLAELKKSESTAEKQAVNRQLNEDIALLEGNLKRKGLHEKQEVYAENLKVDGQLTKALDQYKETQAENDKSRKETVENIKKIEAGQDEMSILANKKKTDEIRKTVEYSENIRELEQEGYREMKEDLLAINKEVKSQEEMLQRAARVKAEEKNKQREETVENIKKIEAGQDEMSILANKEKTEEIRKTVEYSENVRELEKEGHREMKEDLLAINEEVKSQEEMLERAARVKAQEKYKQREETINEIDLTESKVASARKGKDEKTKQNHESVKAIEASIDVAHGIKSEAEEKEKQKTQKYLEELEEKDFNYTSEIANSLGDEYPEGVSQKTFVTYDKKNLPIKIVTRRIVVQNGRGEVYIRVQNTRSAATFSKNGNPISEMAWVKATENENLEKHY
jgi:epidermal growth factor receptor substrate 15